MLEENKVKEYWDNRSKQQGKGTVGFCNVPLSEQDKNYEMRKEFIFRICPNSVPTLDYGCGVGRYSQCFSDQYLGVDVCETLLDIAEEENKNKEFLLLGDPRLPRDFSFEFLLFFTATVLQHNSDGVVRDIFSSLRDSCPQNKLVFFSIYENSFANGDTIKGRSCQEYSEIISEFFSVISPIYRSHSIHGEKHDHLYAAAIRK